MSHVAIAGPHSPKVDFKDDFRLLLVKLAARTAVETFNRVEFDRDQRVRDDSDQLMEHLTVSCTCGEPTCGLAATYVFGMVYGLSYGSEIGMSAGLSETLRSRRDNAPLIPPDLKLNVALTLPNDINVNLKPSAGITVEYDAEGKVTGTKPKSK